jgi:hypothetical protein
MTTIEINEHSVSWLDENGLYHNENGYAYIGEPPQFTMVNGRFRRNTSIEPVKTWCDHGKVIREG